MKNSIVFWLIPFLIYNVDQIKSSDSEDVMIESIDLTLEYKHDGKTTVMEAYRSKRNDEIIKRNETSRFGQLEWHSIGYPTLANLPSKHSSLPMANIFEITPNGFHLLIEILTDNQKEIFREKVKSKYGIDVSMSQIIKLVPSALKCTTKVVCFNGSPSTIYGEAHTLTTFPLNVEFDAPFRSKEIECFKHHLISHQRLKIDCVIRKKSKAVKQNTFSINWEQMSKTNLIEKIFGDAKEVFVSRHQMGELASEVYQSMNVYEEYEMSDKEFSSNFIDELIKQNNADFKLVPIDTVLKSLSKYSTKDLSPNVIKKNLSKVLKVKTNGNKKHLVTDSMHSKSNFEKNNLDIRGSISGGYKLFSASASARFANAKQSSWASSEKNLMDQLEELNTHSQDEIEWELVGEKIVQKRLNVNRFVKASFKKNLKFERIKRVVQDYIFNKKFSLEYKDDKKKLYNRIANKLISTESSNKLEKIHTDSLFKCLEACEENSNCHYAQFLPSDCYLYDKIAHFSIGELKMQDSGVQLYERNIFSKREYKRYKLTNWFKKVDKNVKNSTKCWEECLKELECVAVNYHRTKFECYLFKHDFIVEDINDNNYVTICFSDALKPHRYEKTMLDNEYLNLTTNNEDLCWKECLKHSTQCFAVSYSQTKCKLHRKGEYLVKQENDWVSISFEKEILNKKHSIDYMRTRLVGQYLSELSNLTMYSCWNKCLDDGKCDAISFTSRTCQLFEKGQFIIVRDNDYNSIFSQSVNLDKNYMMRHENMMLINEYRSLSSSSEFTCWNECLKSSECAVISYKDSKCNLYRKGEYLIEQRDNWVSISYEDEAKSMTYSNFYKNTRLVNHFGYLIISSEFLCWKECLKIKDCVAITYFNVTSECFSYKKNQYIVIGQYENWNSITRQDELLDDDEYYLTYQNTRLINHFDCIQSDLEFSCLRECSNKPNCVAITYSNGTCCFYKENDYRAERQDGWKTIALRNQKIQRKYSIKQNKTQISVFFLSKYSQSEVVCLEECIKRKNVCIAISFGENRCHLVKKGEYQLNRFDDWVTIYLENENPKIIDSERKSNFSAIKILNGHNSSIWSLAALQNGDLVSGAADNTIKIWNSIDGTLNQTLYSHNGTVSALIVLHNGNFVSGSIDMTIKIWNHKYEVERTLTEHTASVYCLAVFPNTDFASGSGDNTILIWSSNGDLKKTLRGHSDLVRTLIVLPSGKLASGSHDRTIKIWSSDGTLEKTLNKHSDRVLSLAVLNNGFLASGSSDKTVKIWDESCQVVYTHYFNAIVKALAVLPNGDLILGFSDAKIRIIKGNQIKSQVINEILSEHSALVNALVALSNGDFASASEDTKMIIWSQEADDTNESGESGESDESDESNESNESNETDESIDFNPIDSTSETSGFYDSNQSNEPKDESSIPERKNSIRYNKTQISGFYLWINKTSEEECLEECLERKNVCIAVSFGENRCHLVKKGDYRLRRFNDWVTIYLDYEDQTIAEKNSSFFAKREFEVDIIKSLAVLQNGDLASASIDKTVKIWNSLDGSLNQTLYLHSAVTSLAVLHNGFLVSGLGDGTIKIWNSNYELERNLTDGHSKWILCLAVFPNSDFASGSWDKTILIWSSNGDLKRTIRSQTNWIWSLVVLPNGKLASGSIDNTIKIWSSDGTIEQTLDGHTGYIYSLAVLNNGYLASGSSDETVKIWDESGQLIYTHSFNASVKALAVLPNGDLIIGCSDGKIRIKDENRIDGDEIKTILSRNSDWVNSIAIFSNGDFASASEDNKMIIWSQEFRDANESKPNES